MRQGIIKSQRADLFLGQFARSDIAHNANEMGNLTCHIFDGRNHHILVIFGAILCKINRFTVPDVSCTNTSPYRLVIGRLVFIRSHNVVDAPANHFARAIAGQVAKGRIDPFDLAILIGDDRCVGRRIEYGILQAQIVLGMRLLDDTRRQAAHALNQGNLHARGLRRLRVINGKSAQHPPLAVHDGL